MEKLQFAHSTFTTETSYQDEYYDLSKKTDCISNQLEILFNTLPCGVILLDENGLVSDCNKNAEDILGCKLLGEKWLELINCTIAPKADDGHEVSLSNGKRVQIATNSLSPEPGQIILINDLTHTRELQDRLNQKKQLEEMGEMAAQMAHQLRTPLATAIIYSKHLQTEVLNDNKRIQFSNKILDCLNSIETQIQDMLLFSRGGEHLQEAVSVDRLIQEVVSIIEPQLLRQNISLIIDNNTHNLILRCNQQAIIGAIHNLINNAVDALDQNRFIEFIIQSSGHVLELIIKDHGIGMDAVTQQRALQPFFTSKVKGTGLGLCVVQGIARAHNGELSIESTLGEGSCIRIRLPIKKTEEE